MGWTAPKTWCVGETLTAANFNTHIRDNQLAEGPHLIARKTADQSVTSSAVLVDDTAPPTSGGNHRCVAIPVCLAVDGSRRW